ERIVLSQFLQTALKRAEAVSIEDSGFSNPQSCTRSHARGVVSSQTRTDHERIEGSKNLARWGVHLGVAGGIGKAGRHEFENLTLKTINHGTGADQCCQARPRPKARKAAQACRPNHTRSSADDPDMADITLMCAR